MTSPRLNKLLALLAAEPHDAFTLYGAAQEYAKLGDAAAAVAHYDRCLAVDPGYCYAYYHKARTLADDGQEPAAIAALRAGIDAAQRAGDGKVLGELTTFLDSLI